MSTEQPLIGGYFQATGRKRQISRTIPESKKCKDAKFNFSPTKSIISKEIVFLQKQLTQNEANKPTARKSKPAPARKPRGGKKLMQVSAPPPVTRLTRRNVTPASNETFSQLDNALTNRKSPLKPSTPLNSGMKALSATKQDSTADQQQIPKVTTVTSPKASYNTPTILKIPKNDPSTIEQVNKVRSKLMAKLEPNGKYNIPPLPIQTKANKKQTLAMKLAEPTKVELKQMTNEETLKPIECPSVESCASPCKKDSVIRRLALMKTPEKSPKMNEFKELEFSSPTKMKRTNTTPIKTPQYQSLSHLVSDSRMPISYTHSVLLEHFRCCDVVLSMVERRKETCAFEKLQRAVTTMSGKQMTSKNMAQILFIYPTAFSLSYQPIRTSINSPRRGQHQLIIAANNDLHSESPTSINTKSVRSLTNQELLVRKDQFRASIAKYISKYHAEFLLSMVPPVVIPFDQIKRWHPDFDLNTLPAIPEGNMPRKPQSNTPQTAKQILASSHELLPTRISRVMLKFIEDNSSQQTELEFNTTNEVRNNESNELKGISKNLIERIRIREQEKVKLSMVRDDKQIQKLDMLEKLPEMCSIVRNMYLAEKRGTLPWADVVYKLRESHHSKMDQKYLEEHLILLLEILPQWTSVVTLKNTKYLKVKRNTPLNKLLSDLGREKARLETQ